MKKAYESPKIETYEYTVAARLAGSGIVTGVSHDSGSHTSCTLTEGSGCGKHFSTDGGSGTGSC